MKTTTRNLSERGIVLERVDNITRIGESVGQEGQVLEGHEGVNPLDNRRGQWQPSTTEIITRNSR